MHLGDRFHITLFYTMPPQAMVYANYVFFRVEPNRL